MAPSNLDDKIQQLAITNFAQFLVLIGHDALQAAKARMLRAEGKSYQQIALKLGMTIQQVRTAVKNEQGSLSKLNFESNK